MVDAHARNRYSLRKKNVIASFYPVQFRLVDYLQKIDTEGCLKLKEKSDSKEYRAILNETIVAVPVPEADREIQSVSFKPTRRLTLRDIVFHVIENVRIKSVKSNENVLAFGYEAVGEHNRQGTVSGYPTLKNSYINATVDYFLSEPWQLLHERVGDDVMFHLLTRVSMFQKFASSCCLQISGHPITLTSVLSKDKRNSNPKIDLPIREKTGKRKRNENGKKLAKTKRRRRSNACVVQAKPQDNNNYEEPKASVSQKRKAADQPKKCCKLKKRKLNSFRQKATKKRVFFPFHRLSLPRSSVPKTCMKKKKKTKCQSLKVPTTNVNVSWNKQFFPRSSMFYSTSGFEQLPLNHILKSLNASKVSARKLINEIFLRTKIKKHGENKSQKRLPRRYFNMISLFSKLIERHRRCSVRALLNHYCPYKEPNVDKIRRRLSRFNNVTSICRRKNRRSHHALSKSDGTTSEVNEAEKKLVYQQALASYSSHNQVMGFIRSVCNKVIPLEFWGNKTNRKIFFKNFGRFVRLNKGEKFQMAQMMNGLKVSQCSWLKLDSANNKSTPPSESLKQKQIFGQFVWWLVREYLMIILKNSFYITETQTHRNKAFYFRKLVWRRILNYGLESLENSSLIELEAQTTRPDSPREFSFLRFLPKASKVRPIINMNHCQVATISDGKQSKSVASPNWKLNDAFKILKFEKENNPTQLGSSLFGVDDFYRELKMFVMKRQRMGDSRPLYLAHVDINCCYESIIQEKLCDILESALQEDQYFIRQFHILRFSSADKIKKLFTKHVSSDEDSDVGFVEFLNREIAQSKLNNVVIVDSTRHITKERETILQLLKEHIQCCVVKIGKRFYHKTRGIAQGSCASTLFCNYYYGNMEKEYFQDISSDEDSLLLRWVDDFLLITPHLELANKFLQRMHSGIPEYGCSVNSEKSLVNFDAKTPDGTVVKKVGRGEKFPWCGFLLDQQLLNVQCDYGKYAGCQLNDTITAELIANPGLAIKSKLQCMLRPKCHPLLLDPQINTSDTVLTNIYQAFLLSACKFIAHVRRLPKGHGPANNPSFFAQLILDLPEHVCKQISRRFSKLSHGQSSFAVRNHVVYRLCLRAFQVCLQRKQTRFKELLKFLKKALGRLKGRLNKEQGRVIDQCQNEVTKHLL